MLVSDAPDADATTLHPAGTHPDQLAGTTDAPHTMLPRGLLQMNPSCRISTVKGGVKSNSVRKSPLLSKKPSSGDKQTSILITSHAACQSYVLSVSVSRGTAGHHLRVQVFSLYPPTRLLPQLALKNKP